jgi:hypothetical protein
VLRWPGSSISVLPCRPHLPRSLSSRVSVLIFTLRHAPCALARAYIRTPWFPVLSPGCICRFLYHHCPCLVAHAGSACVCERCLRLAGRLPGLISTVLLSRLYLRRCLPPY